jgi:hypothetical protein
MKNIKTFESFNESIEENPLEILKREILNTFPKAKFIGELDDSLVVHTSTEHDEEGSGSTISGVRITNSTHGDKDFSYGWFMEWIDNEGEAQDTDASTDYGGDTKDVIDHLKIKLSDDGSPYIS